MHMRLLIQIQFISLEATSSQHLHISADATNAHMIQIPNVPSTS